MRFAILGALILAGCGPDGPKLVAVGGTVKTKDRTPIGGATVRFVPDAAKNVTGLASVAVTDADGRFELKYDGTPGAVAGWHKVTVAPPNDRTPPAGKVAAPKMIPARYSSETKTPLEFEVKPGQSNVYEIVIEN